MLELIPLILAVTIVVVVSTICSLFEAVLYSVPVSHIESLVEEDRRTGKLLRRLRENVDEPITAILTLNTISHTAGASIAGALAASALGEDNLVVFSAVFTLLILLLSEILPKTAGVIYSRPLSTIIAVPLEIMVIVFKPFIWLAGLVTKLISGKAMAEMISAEELVVMTRVGQRMGAIEPDEAAVIQNILALSDKTAADVLTPRTVIFGLRADLTVAEVWQEEGLWTHSRAPVYNKDPDETIGILHRPDFLAAVAEGRLDAKLSELMKPVYFVPETVPLDRLLRRFLKRGQHMFAVVDEFGGLSGVVTLEDVLEEILGQEIVDEYDEVEDMQELARQRRQAALRDMQSSSEFEDKRGQFTDTSNDRDRANE